MAMRAVSNKASLRSDSGGSLWQPLAAFGSLWLPWFALVDASGRAPKCTCWGVPGVYVVVKDRRESRVTSSHLTVSWPANKALYVGV